ncbi:MAG: hypothetical protein R2822_10100 [Spirosomataceae bacterium]
MKYALLTICLFLYAYHSRAQPSKLIYSDPKQLREIGGDATVTL